MNISSPKCGKCLSDLKTEYDAQNRAKKVECPKCGIIFERTKGNYSYEN